jgi:GntR family transcriptional regulator of vanillate catabolism
MKRPASPAPTDLDTKTSRDNDSQVSRATLGLREMLLRGALQPGQRIAEIPLSKKLGVSRTPLRLAFERLEHEGLIKALPHSGFTATKFTISDIWDAIEICGVLEGAAARLAAERLKNPALLEPLRKICRAMEVFSDLTHENVGQILELNTAFHKAILELAQNRILQRAIEHLQSFPFASPGSRVLVHMTLRGSKEVITIAEDQHRAIIDAIEHREGSRAEALSREHARLARRNLEEALADPTALETIPGAHLITKDRGSDRI